MQNVLLVEDSKMFGKVIKKRVESVFHAQVYWAGSLAEADRLLTMDRGTFSLALLDFNLPDAPNGEVIERVVREGISSLVFTSNMSDEVREYVWSKKVADYILKEDPNSLDYLFNAIRQLEENGRHLILVVDDSPTYRTALSELLYIRKYRVLNASDGEGCLEILKRHPEVKLVITDYNMPGMDGVVLCRKIREMRKSDQLSIIGVSSENDPGIGARFLKSGADDFVVKGGFSVEEFYSRVSRSIETINLFAQIKESAVRDFLTGLYNRRYFFEAGEALLVRSTGKQLLCTMLDIDHFKGVNDTYGHDVGDIVIKKTATLLQDNAAETDIVARIGGEEFCVLGPAPSIDEGLERFEKLRQVIEQTPMALVGEKGEPLHVTISTGLCYGEAQPLEIMMKKADECLYRAKENGRNRVEFIRG